MSGDAHVRFCERPRVRFPRATHPVMIFADEDDARRVLTVLSKRFEKYGLTLHPEKTRLLNFKRPNYSPNPPRPPQVKTRRETFDFLGITVYWSAGRHGLWIVKQRTASTAFTRALTRVRAWCKRNRHRKVAEQYRKLVEKLRGHYRYFDYRTNGRMLNRFRHELTRIWRTWLNRRGGRKKMTWPRFNRLLERYRLPTPAELR
jgi:RNA-directed DNA polymerase